MNRDFRLMPEQASSIAAEVDALYAFLLIVSGVLTILIAGLIVFYAIKYRRGSPAARSVGTTHFFVLETIWIVGPLLITLVMFIWGAQLYFKETRPPPDALQIDCVARQWMWKFQHPEGKSEINDLHVPLGQDVRVNMISEDVIHSLYIPAFRIKQDVLPTRYATVWFRPTKVGQYHLFCAEYCGAKHSEMGGVVHVLEPREYQTWLSGGTVGISASEAGQELFTRFRCDTCHLGEGAMGRGPPLENLFGSEVLLTNGQKITADEGYIRESILNPTAKVVAGYQPIMPLYAGQIGEEGLLQLIAKIKSMSPRGRGAVPTIRKDQPEESTPP
jgi:cytochrome c oxidase subunit 2